ncbi:hypothetical protein [Actinomadura atramentaria]|uniref:hypothetical protein n=1 Tax=Actinomadura atramentaria TaxID=1990 RepID=UPI0003659398|nr:hypothetical protein [Actinomadura atramentaria]
MPPSKHAARIAELEAALDSVYTERARLVAFLAASYDSVIINRDDAWPLVYVKSPFGQLSWHLSEDDVELFEHVPDGGADWDGHGTAEKYERLRALTNLTAARRRLASARSSRSRRRPVRSV